MHFDAKFHEEADSEVIFPITIAKNGQKIHFIQDFGNFRKIEFSENLKQIALFDHFSGGLSKK